MAVTAVVAPHRRRRGRRNSPSARHASRPRRRRRKPTLARLLNLLRLRQILRIYRSLLQRRRRIGCGRTGAKPGGPNSRRRIISKLFLRSLGNGRLESLYALQPSRRLSIQCGKRGWTELLRQGIGRLPPIIRHLQRSPKGNAGIDEQPRPSGYYLGSRAPESEYRPSLEPIQLLGRFYLSAYSYIT